MFRTIAKIYDHSPYTLIFHPIREKMPSLSTKERKAKSAKLRMTVKEFNELLNLITIQDGMEKLDTIRQQQIIEIDEIWDKIEEFQDLIENLEILLEKNNIKKET